jgi:hypothetical protein
MFKQGEYMPGPETGAPQPPLPPQGPPKHERLLPPYELREAGVRELVEVALRATTHRKSLFTRMGSNERRGYVTGPAQGIGAHVELNGLDIQIKTICEALDKLAPRDDEIAVGWQSYIEEAVHGPVQETLSVEGA